MSLYRLCKGLTLTIAGVIMIATSAIALNDLHADTTPHYCAIDGPAGLTDPVL